MAELEEAIFARATATTNITTHISATVPRFYPDGVPRNIAPTYPLAIQQRISTERVHGIDGPQGLAVARQQVTCWSTNPDTTAALATAVRQQFDGHTGTWGGVVVEDCTLEDDGDMLNLSPAADEARTYGRRLDFQVYFQEAT